MSIRAGMNGSDTMNGTTATGTAVLCSVRPPIRKSKSLIFENKRCREHGYMPTIPAHANHLSLGSIMANTKHNDRRVMVIYTGGTIGMVNNVESVLAPVANEFEQHLRTFPQLHDEKYLRQKAEEIEIDETFLVLPEMSNVKSRIFYKIHEYEHLLDSSNMTAEEWIKIARDIMANYEDYDGFLVLHGTDTLSYTASALSFVLEDIGKCVVVTGSQISIFEPRSDGANNFVSALVIAGTFNIPEVTVFFCDKLLRGNRTQKISAENLDAFHSPNFSPLVKVGIGMEVNTKAIFRPTTLAKCKLHDSLSANVGVLRVFPSISASVIKAFLQPPIEGVVFESYGSGNIPSNRPDIYKELNAAVKRGVIIVNITQCPNGSVQPIYETGQRMEACGVISGFDLTPEAALTKLSYVLSKTEWDLATKKKMMMTNLRGELTNNLVLKVETTTLTNALNTWLQIQCEKQSDDVTSTVLTALLFFAIDRGDQEMLVKIQEMGGDLNNCNSDGQTPLHEAVQMGNLEIIKSLLQQGASVHVKSRIGESPLMVAIQRGDQEAIELLKTTGAHLSPGDHKLITEQLLYAAKTGMTDKIESLRLAGADLNSCDDTKHTALHKAVICSQEHVVEYLLQKSVDVNLVDFLGYSPLQYAEKLERTNILKLLTRNNDK